MKAELLIAGIPATEWIGRRARFWGHENKQHPTPCLIRGIDNKKIVILPIGHKQDELVDPKDIAPTWKNNGDLREKYAAQLNGSLVEDPPDDIPEIIVPRTEAPRAEAEPEPAPVVEEVLEEPEPEVPSPKMVIHNHSADWVPAYQKYVKALQSEHADRALHREVVKSINAHRAEQVQLIAELAAMGVEIQDERALVGATNFVEEAAAPVGAKKRMTRKEIDRIVIDWAKAVKARVQAGEEVTGNINAWAAQLGITWAVFHSRLDMVEKVPGIRMHDDQGRTGKACRGEITVKLVD